MARSIDRTKKLKTTITDLENALASWDYLSQAPSGPDALDHLASRPETDFDSASPFEKVYSASTLNGSTPWNETLQAAPHPNSPGRGLPTEVRKRTLDLLNQLKVQIDELSTEDAQS